MGFNRNIIIQADVDRLMDPNSGNPRTLTASPPSGFIPTLTQAGAVPAGAAVAGVAAGEGGAGAAAPGGVTVPSADDYLTKLVKYIPVEVLAAQPAQARWQPASAISLIGRQGHRPRHLPEIRCPRSGMLPPR